MKSMKKIAVISALCVTSLAALNACSTENTAKAAAEVVTQKVVPQEKTPITILVKYAFTINGFEKAVEDKFPNIDIIQVGNYTKDMGIAEYERRLEHDDLTDIVMTWPLNVGNEYWDERLVDLSGFDFTSRYNLSMLNSISDDGTLYYLPGPSQVRGIVYNKTLFMEKGWPVPKNYDEFITLCQTIEASGIKALQLGFENEEVLDTAFIGYNYADYFSKPQDSQWLADYNKGIGSFGDHFSSALDTFQNMADAGVFQASDLDVDYAKRETMLFTRQCAMTEDSVLMARMGYQKTGTTDEFALMPFFNPSTDSDWARLYMVCFIGMNKHLTEPDNKEKLELVLQIMDYISTPEGQAALSADTGAMYSSLMNVSPPNISEIQDLIPALDHGRYAIFPELTNAQSALRTGLAGMLKGTLSKEDVIRIVDQQNLAPPAEILPEVFGTATDNFTLTDTGNFVTDAMRTFSGCDFALFFDNGKDGKYNGKGISGSIYQGDITETDINCILPDMKQGEAGTLLKVTMTGENLLNTLEYSLPVDNSKTGWFYYFSGLKMEFAPTREPGTRIRKITASDGTPIDDARTYTIAVMDHTVPEEFILEKAETGVTIFDVLKANLMEHGSISPSTDKRFQLYQ